MAVSAKAIKTKIGSVKNVGKITKAMELVSVSKMKRSTESVLATRPYATRALEVLTNLSKNRILRHRFLSHGDTGRNLIVIVSSNKGLCGSYNVNVAKATRSFLGRVEKKHGSEIDLITVGKRSEKIARSLGKNITASFVNFNENLSLAEARSLSGLIKEEFESGKYFNVVMVYTNYVSALSNEVLARQVLPVRPENIQNMLIESRENRSVADLETEDFSQYLFEPNEEVLLDAVLSRLTDIQVYQALLESQASEHSARMMAMKNATENAHKLADELTLSYNRARQAGITREISEIASGADALS